MRWSCVLRTATAPSAVGTDLAYPLGDILLLSAVFGIFSLGMAAGETWLVPGSASSPPPSRTPCTSSSPPRDVSARDAARSLVAGLDAAHHLGGVIDNGDERGLAVEGRPARRAGDVRPPLIGILVYDHFGGVNLLAMLLATATSSRGPHATRRDLPREPAALVQTHQEATTDALTGLLMRLDVEPPVSGGRSRRVA